MLQVCQRHPTSFGYKRGCNYQLSRQLSFGAVGSDLQDFFFFSQAAYFIYFGGGLLWRSLKTPPRAEKHSKKKLYLQTILLKRCQSWASIKDNVVRGDGNVYMSSQSGSNKTLTSKSHNMAVTAGWIAETFLWRAGKTREQRGAKPECASKAWLSTSILKTRRHLKNLVTNAPASSVWGSTLVARATECNAANAFKTRPCPCLHHFHHFEVEKGRWWKQQHFFFLFTK